MTAVLGLSRYLEGLLSIMLAVLAGEEINKHLCSTFIPYVIKVFNKPYLYQCYREAEKLVRRAICASTASWLTPQKRVLLSFTRKLLWFRLAGQEWLAIEAQLVWWMRYR